MTEPGTAIHSHAATVPSGVHGEHAVSAIGATAQQNTKDVTQWSSAEVQHWIEEQCQKFELKKATTEKFQLNGQALVLLTKHDFLRRSPDGGEILYYALQRMIKPNKTTAARNNSNLTRNGSLRQSTRITELDSDTDEQNSAANSLSSTQPIIEEPDDPPAQRKSDSDSSTNNSPHQRHPRSFFRPHTHMHQAVFTAPTAAYFYPQQQPPPQAQVYPNAYVYAQQQYYQHHPPPPPQAHVHFLHQYQPMMAAQGILIEQIEREEAKNLFANGTSSSLNDSSNDAMNIDALPGQLYLITMNGQRYIMNEEQLRHYANEFQQQQMLHQQHFQQQQQYQYQQQRPASQDNLFHTT